nr:hypothetical protein L204_02043 [Cryptococcus depauperatus CBS 7855]
MLSKLWLSWHKRRYLNVNALVIKIKHLPAISIVSLVNAKILKVVQERSCLTWVSRGSNYASSVVSARQRTCTPRLGSLQALREASQMVAIDVTHQRKRERIRLRRKNSHSVETITTALNTELVDK